MTDRLRIAQLANFVGPVSGGMKVAIDQLGKQYVQAGCDRILVVPGQHDHVEETENGIVVQVAAPKISKQYRMIATPWRALSVLDRFRPTSIEVSDKWTLTQAASWARRRGIGSVLFSHERLDDMLAGWLRRQFGVEAAVGALNRRLVKQFDVIVVTSDYSSGEFSGLGAELHKVPLGVDLETFHPSMRPQGLPTPQDDGVIRLCYVGRMSHEKNPELAMRAAMELHRRGLPVQMDMYGVGPDLQAMQDESSGFPVTFHGFVESRTEVARAYAYSDISMSVCPTETFGLAVLEALACGTPVVTSNRGGAYELVDASSGASGFPNPSGIADATTALINRLGPGLRASARARAEQFTWQESAHTMLQIHAGLTERIARRPYWKDNLVDARLTHREKHGVKDLLSPTNTTTQQSQEER